MIYKLIEHGEVVQTGELIDNIFRGKKVTEGKAFFNVSSPLFFDHPTIEILSDDKRKKTAFDLSITDKGFAGTQYEYGYNYGCNLNRVKNRANRWGLTVWAELTSERAAV